MIPIPAQYLFSLYVGVWFVLLAILWLIEAMRSSKGDWSIEKERLYKCDRCHHSFLASDDSENVTRCPRCNEMCFIKKRKRF